MRNNLKRFSFLGTNINAINSDQTEQLLLNYSFQKTGYISFPDSSVITKAYTDERLRQILNNSLLTLPDGMPSVLFARSKGYKNINTVSGYWLCLSLLNSTLSHFFLGSTQERLDLIKSKIEKEIPHAKIKGFKPLPFLGLDFYSEGNVLDEIVNEINRLKPDLIWIGLSSPKQDYFMKYHAPHLKHGLMLGVGGVFDYLSGEVKKSPEFIKRLGLRWLWRLVLEPARLGPKYWYTIKMFFTIFIQQFVKDGQHRKQ